MEYESSYGKTRGFKIGDRVRIKHSDGVAFLESSWALTLSGEVGRIKYRGSGEWRVVLDNCAKKSGMNDGSWGLQDEELELIDDSAEAPPIASPRKPRVGDKVRLTAKGYEYFRVNWPNETSDYYVGLVGKLTDVNAWRGTYDLWVEFFDVKQGGCSLNEGWAMDASLIEFIDTPVIERAYPAPRNTTVEEAKHGDDRPATNGEEFEMTMLAHFDENDAGRLLSLAATWALFPAQANQAIDLGLFAQRIKRRLDGQAA